MNTWLNFTVFDNSVQNIEWNPVIKKLFYPRLIMVELKGVEPLTPCLQSRCSDQLSYSPTVLIINKILVTHQASYTTNRYAILGAN